MRVTVIRGGRGEGGGEEVSLELARVTLVLL